MADDECTDTYPRTACSRRRDGKAVRTFTVCRRMRRITHSTLSSPPLAMKAGIHSTLPLRLWSLRTKRCTHSSLFRSWKARCTTEGFMVTKLVRSPTSAAYSSTGARLHLPNKQFCFMIISSDITEHSNHLSHLIHHFRIPRTGQRTTWH